MPIVAAISAVVVQSSFDLWPKVILNLGLGLGLSLAVAVPATHARFVRPLLGLRPIRRRGIRANGPVLGATA
jgi:hypothetical protein